ncbi:MBL fold metallo-hydrolase [Streptomyces sp. NBC_00151]|uniref:MBL fold metallo-hydrolase n=1 Tax=Streptomyces sp. NBC_00151 TaxID=2975669 RepID=UPI002DD7CF04|nr:MBL fold metallo-hydrolase [Streptomyces sp. NBC_00151]WRZ44632.1 MBL fold metallo-hydrolase [Streptomyces sp. NBC_00151]
MGYEIDFLPVGEESKGGDAIALRFGNLRGVREEQTVMVVDGGYTDCGDALVEHIEKHYDTDRIDSVVSTHTDQDHICDLKTVQEKTQVGQLLMHLPWEHSATMERARTSTYWRGQLNDPARRMLEAAMELEALARGRGVEVVEPFVGIGSKDGIFTVLGPSETYYEQLLTDLVGPTAKSAAQLNFEAMMRKILEAARKLVPETWLDETLRDDGTTTPTNNASVVSLLDVDGVKVLLTGDAGILALTHIADALEDRGFTAGDLGFIQVPHHGSRNNVGPTVLDRLLGPAANDITRGLAYVSAPRKNPDNRHPAKKVTNAFLRRGYPVHATQGASLLHRHDAPDRSGYGPATPLPFHHMVEDDGGA